MCNKSIKLDIETVAQCRNMEYSPTSVIPVPPDDVILSSFNQQAFSYRRL